MGNGVGVQGKYVVYSPRSDFTSLERKCKSGYFRNHMDDYLEAVAGAIQSDAMDVLELLVTAADITEANPLHIAAKYSSIESLELLLSAGISPFLQDRNGRTALHIAAGKKGENSVLCVYALVLAGERALKMKDKKGGNTPLHIATTTNNIRIVEVLVNSGASLSATNSAGHSPRSIALGMKHQEIVYIIDEKRTGKMRTKQAISQQKQPYGLGKDKPPDMERIMAVWERFFENALSGVDFSIANDAQGVDEGRYGYVERESDFGAEYSSRPAEHVVKDSYEEHVAKYAVLNQQDQDPCTMHTTQMGFDLYAAAAAWFSHVLSYDHDRTASTATPEDKDWSDDGDEVCADAVDGYFVSSCVVVGDPAQDLDDHLYTQEQYDVWCGYQYAQTLDNDWPNTVENLIQKGWITFYDVNTNQCMWMYLPSGETESYLPVGTDLEMSEYVGLEPYDFDDSTWVRPPQVTARSWVMIRIPGRGADCLRLESFEDYSDSKAAAAKHVYNDAKGVRDAKRFDSKASESVERRGSIGEPWNEVGDREEGEDDVWYYYNRISGHSMWTQPPGWDELIAAAGGWILCAEEGKLHDLYW